MSIQQSARLVEALASTLARLMEARPITDAGPDAQLLARFCAYTVRQVQGVCILIGRDDSVPSYFAEQAAQLVRGLVETWSRSAWLMQPKDEGERSQRALRLVKDSLVEMRRSLDVATQAGIPISQALMSDLQRQESFVASEEAALGGPVNLVPPTRQLCEDLGRLDLYYVFSRESDPAHVSAVTLASTVQLTDGTSQHLGGPNRRERQAQLLLTTRALLEAAGTVMVEGLGLDSGSWANDQRQVREATDALLLPILDEPA